MIGGGSYSHSSHHSNNFLPSFQQIVFVTVRRDKFGENQRRVSEPQGLLP